MNEDEKAVYKTAFELDQRWVIELAADRTPFIDQSQSVNIFLPADIHKRDLHQIHFMAWKRGMKSLYYCRSKSIQRAEDITTRESAEGVTGSADTDFALPATIIEKLPLVARDVSENTENTDYEDCIACQ